MPKKGSHHVDKFFNHFVVGTTQKNQFIFFDAAPNQIITIK